MILIPLLYVIGTTVNLDRLALLLPGAKNELGKIISSLYAYRSPIEKGSTLPTSDFIALSDPKSPNKPIYLNECFSNKEQFKTFVQGLLLLCERSGFIKPINQGNLIGGVFPRFQRVATVPTQVKARPSARGRDYIS